MIGYATLGTNDLDRAGAFYDRIAEALGGKRVFRNDRGIGWSSGKGVPMLMVMKPFDGKPASAGNGTMIAIPAGNKEMVDAVYKLAIELGAQDEGPAGPRGERFYGGYFRDPDGNKLAVYCMG
jgi:predicted lactoylglutathione lyase